MSDKHQNEQDLVKKEVGGGAPSAPQTHAGGVADNDLPNMNRRSFFTRTLVGGGAAIAAGGVAVGASKMSLEGRKSEGIVTNGKVKPFDNRDHVTYMALAPKNRNRDINKARVKQYMELNKSDFDFTEGDRRKALGRYDNNIPGKTHLDRAIYVAASALSKYTKGGRNDFVPADLETWFNQDDVWHEQYEFSSDKQKADVVKSAARMFGAGRVGIARWDKRFAYEPMYHPKTDKTYTWDEDVPFTPKSVITMVIPLDYDAIATSPSFTAAAANVEVYMKSGNLYTQLAHFLRDLGYPAMGGHNSYTNSVAYGILAGLGEGGRNNQLIVPGIGPRHRICKVITELDFGDAYDEPRSWGVTEFCESCMKCADACPSGAISTEVKRSYEPKYEHCDEPGYTWNNHIGALKWYSDAKKCYQFWVENEANCSNCMAACTFNEPDFWHHWLIAAVNPAMPKFVHALMAEAHPAFGYGGQGPLPMADKADKFWKSGAGMRTNLSNKNNNYTSGPT